MKTHRGFTLIELLVVVSLIAMLMSILLPSLAKAKELANRVHCASNVKGIVSSFIVYSMENADRFPLGIPAQDNNVYVPYIYPTAPVVPSPPLPLKTLDAAFNYTMAHTDPFTHYHEHAADALAPFYMLIERGIQSKLFLCKSDLQAGIPASLKDVSQNFYDAFQNENQICYSIPFPWKNGMHAPWWRNFAEFNQVIISDMAPFQDANGYKTPSLGVGKKANSDNHNGAGQNVGFADGHVEWATTPKVGRVGENIFSLKVSQTDVSIHTASVLPSGGVPSADDIIMIPTRSAVDYSLK